MENNSFLNNISIVLVRPKYSSNIGSSARAMKNCGIENLVVVSPVEYDVVEAKKLSTHAAADILDNAEFYNDIDEALSKFNYIVGTTARLGRQRNISISTPVEMAEKVSSLSSNNKVAVLFGPEDKGLLNSELNRCQLFVNIPTAGFSSLNLSQAVMILSYEIHKILSEPPEYYSPELASKFQLDSMYEHLKDILINIDFINRENPDHWLNNIKIFLSRLPMRAKEVNILRGILRQINWYGQEMYRRGKNGEDQ